MNNQHHHEEDRLARLLAETQYNVAPVDESFLTKLRSQTLKVVKSESTSPSPEPARPHHSILNGSKSHRRRPMVRFGLSLTAVTLLVIGVALISWSKSASGLTLAEGLASLDQLQSFEATQRGSRGNETLRYLKPAMLRIDQGNTYLLHRDGQSWEVN